MVPSSILIATWVLLIKQPFAKETDCQRQDNNLTPYVFGPNSDIFIFWGDMLKSLSFSSKSRWTQDYHRHAVVAIGCHDMSGSYGSERRVVSFKQTEVSELPMLHGAISQNTAIFRLNTVLTYVEQPLRFTMKHDEWQ